MLDWIFTSSPKSEEKHRHNNSPSTQRGNSLGTQGGNSPSIQGGNSLGTQGGPPALPAFPTGVVSPNKKKRLTPAERAKIFSDEVSKPQLDLKRIRELAFSGLPDGSLRSLYWKILLNYLPLDRTKWKSSLEQNRALYKEWHRDLHIDPRQSEVQESPEKEEVDHPLNTDQRSNWNAFFKDNHIIHEIEKDVHRTFPHLHFFQIGQDMEGAVITNPHYQALRSILFMWAKLNPGIAYVQGMNEILGPIYYIFATDPDNEFKVHAEADAFFCFTNLMSEIMNNFCKSLDKTSIGIQKQIIQLNDLLKKKDFQLWINLEEKQLNPQFYSFRWLTLLLSQEFELPDVLRLWDTLFSDKNRFEHLLNVCISMLVTVREQLLKGDFAENLKLLQSYPPTDIIALLENAKDIARPDYVAQYTSFDTSPQKSAFPLTNLLGD